MIPETSTPERSLKHRVSQQKGRFGRPQIICISPISTESLQCGSQCVRCRGHLAQEAETVSSCVLFTVHQEDNRPLTINHLVLSALRIRGPETRELLSIPRTLPHSQSAPQLTPQQALATPPPPSPLRGSDSLHPHQQVRTPNSSGPFPRLLLQPSNGSTWIHSFKNIFYYF